MKPTDEQKVVLRDELLKVLTETRGIFRPSELLRLICHDERFIMFNCMHVGHQLRVLRRSKAIRVGWFPVGYAPGYLAHKLGPYMKLKGWYTADLTREDLHYFQGFTLWAGRPLEVFEWEMLK